MGREVENLWMRGRVYFRIGVGICEVDVLKGLGYLKFLTVLLWKLESKIWVMADI